MTLPATLALALLAGAGTSAAPRPAPVLEISARTYERGADVQAVLRNRSGAPIYVSPFGPAQLQLETWSEREGRWIAGPPCMMCATVAPESEAKVLPGVGLRLSPCRPGEVWPGRHRAVFTYSAQRWRAKDRPSEFHVVRSEPFEVAR